LKPAATTFRSIFLDSNPLLAFTKRNSDNRWLLIWDVQHVKVQLFDGQLLQRKAIM
jgi:hypothetical protein